MFQTLSDRLNAIFQRLRSRGKLTEPDVLEVLREVRIALLEADVNLQVVKDFIASIRERAIGAEVTQSLTPAQAVLKIVHDGLIELMGGSAVPMRFAPVGPTPVLMVGLQGSGKTTQAAKLALHFRDLGRRPLLVACDVYRPAAIDQLQRLGQQIGVPVFTGGGDPVRIAAEAVAEARKIGYGLVVIDTAGRLQIDEPMMEEIERMAAVVQPVETLLVVDALTGQEAVKVAKAFDARVPVTGFIMTKLDGDARGGGALSIRAVTGKPLKFVGVGEKVGALEVFHPERLVSRILGMGDVMTLIEKSQSLFDEDTAKRAADRLRRQSFTLQDFLDQLQQVKKLGSFGDLLKLIPGANQLLAGREIDEREIARMEAIVRSMTPRERADPSILNAGRRKRIARGSGMQVQDVNQLVRRFEDAKKMFKRMKPRLPI